MIKFKNLFEFLKHNPSEQDCINHLEEVIWDGKPPISPFDPTSKVIKCADQKPKVNILPNIVGVNVWIQAIILMLKQEPYLKVPICH